MMTMAPLQVIGSSGDESFSSSSSSLAGRLQYAANDAISGIQSDVKVGVLLLNLGGPETTQDVEGFLYNLFADPDIIRLPSFLSLLQKPIAYFIAKRRAPKSTAAYQSIGGGSPIVKVPCLVLTTIYTPPPPSCLLSLLFSTPTPRPVSSRARCSRGVCETPSATSRCGTGIYPPTHPPHKPVNISCSSPHVLQNNYTHITSPRRYWNPYTEEVLDQMQRDGINTMVVVPLYPQYSISTSGSSLKLLDEIFANNPDTWGKVSHCTVILPNYQDG